MASSLQNPNIIEFCEVFSESKRIVKSQKGHLITLSLIFLFPLSLFTVLFFAFEKTMIISILFTLFALTFSFCAIVTITYTTFHGYNGQSIGLFSSFSPLFTLFIPFFSTLSIPALIFSCLSLILILIYKLGTLLLVFDMKLNSLYFIIPYVIIMIGVGLYLDMKWMLANVIVVVERKRCYQPLHKSAYLVKGLKRVILSFQLVSIVPVGLCLWYCSAFLPRHLGGHESKWLTGLNLGVLLVYYPGFLTLWLLHSLVRNVVVYMQCKSLRGELFDDFTPMV